LQQSDEGIAVSGSSRLPARWHFDVVPENLILGILRSAVHKKLAGLRADMGFPGISLKNGEPIVRSFV
jgi:hypothetical protein